MSDPQTTPSYHDLHITTPKIKRTSIFNLPFRVRVECTRVSGWVVWAMKERDLPEEELGGEYGCDPDTGEGAWLVLDVAGHVICDSRPKSVDITAQEATRLERECQGRPFSLSCSGGKWTADLSVMTWAGPLLTEWRSANAE